MTEELLKTREVLEILKISKTTLRKLENENKLIPFKKK